MRLLAPAKINLFLHITGKRADGYHQLQSLIFFVNVGDVLSVEKAQRNTLKSSGLYAEQLPEPKENIIIQALARLQQQFPAVPPLSILLEKNLPVAAGIGGGSSDAAVVLQRAASLTNIEIPAEFLLSLGAEMPVCYAAQPALVEGIGEQITPWPSLPDWGIVLVNPNQPLPTGEVFKGMQAAEFSAPQPFVIPQCEAEWRVLAQQTDNDMTAAAIRIVPQVKQVLDSLTAQPECFLARMSGSGATCFGLCKTPQAAAEAAERLTAQHPQWWIQHGKII